MVRSSARFRPLLAAMLGLAATALEAQTPPNDLFADRIAMTGHTNSVSGSSAGATRETGEPAHLGHLAGASVWWSWTAPDTGPVTIDTAGSSFDTVLAVYLGDGVGQLERVAENDDYLGEATSGVQFQAIAGTAYQIAVDGFQSASGAVTVTVRLEVEPSAPRLVEQPVDALALEGTTSSVTFAVEARGTVPMQYQWFWNGAEIPGATGASYTVEQPVAAQAGAYRVRVSNALGWVESEEADLTVLRSVANDMFASRTSMMGQRVTVTGDNRAATAEAGDPRPAGVSGWQSVWWTWTAPAAGLVQVDTAGSTFDTILGVYAGSALESLVEVAANDDHGEAFTSAVWFRATAGTAYQILVDGYWSEEEGGSAGEIVLNLAQLGDNDSFAHRLSIEGNPAVVRDSNVGTTREAGEPALAPNAAGRTIWWTWNAFAAGPTSIDTVGSSFPTLLAVYVGPDLEHLSLVAADVDGDSVSRVRFDAAVGAQYQIVVDGWQGAPASAGSVVLNLSQSGDSNDDFADRVPMVGSTNVVMGSNIATGKEPGEPAHAANAGGRSVWWSWVAPFDGEARVSTAGSGFDTLLAVYLGSSVDALTLVAQNDDAGTSLQSEVTFLAAAGVEYHIAVDGFNDAGQISAGAVTLSVVQAVPLAAGGNDRFADRFLLAGTGETVTGSNVAASKEPGEPDHSGNRGGRSVWWSWMAPSNDPVTIDTIGSDFDTTLGVYTGSAVGALTLVESDDDSAGERKSTVTFLPVMGVEYLIAVDGYRDGEEQAAGNIVLTVFQHPPGPQIANDAFAQRTPILPQLHTVRGSNIGATREDGEPAHLGTTVGASVWWSWVAPANGPVTIDTEGSGIDTVLAVYTGSSLPGLALVAANDDIGGGNNKSRVRFQAQAGTQYQIAVEGYGRKIGILVLNVQLAPDATSAPSLVQAPRSQTRFQAGAGGGASVSFSVVALGSLPLSYQWQRGGMNLPGANSPTLTLPNAGQAEVGAYRVIVANALGSVTSEEVWFTWSPDEFNDDFSRRLPVAGDSATVFGSNLGASKEPGEPEHADNVGGRSVWWTWTAPANGRVSVDTYGSSFDTLLAVYEGESLGALTVVASNDDLLEGRNNNSFVSFEAVAGRSYQIAVDGFKTNGLHGRVALNLHQPPEPPRLTVHPLDRTLLTGATLTLEVQGQGVVPLFRYQWYRGGQAIANATDRVLTITGVGPEHRGTYYVEVSNDFGSVISSNAVVQVQVAQRLESPAVLADGRVRFHFQDFDGAVSSDPTAFEVQSTERLAGGATLWQSHPGQVRFETGRLIFESAAAPGTSARFYRVLRR